VSLGGQPSVVSDSIVLGVTSSKASARILRCALFGDRPFGGLARPGQECHFHKPEFIDPRKLDFRLKRNSPGHGLASDGGDLGCRFTHEMAQLRALALELRKRRVIDF
jgi:hypothetical protein